MAAQPARRLDFLLAVAPHNEIDLSEFPSEGASNPLEVREGASEVSSYSFQPAIIFDQLSAKVANYEPGARHLDQREFIPQEPGVQLTEI